MSESFVYTDGLRISLLMTLMLLGFRQWCEIIFGNRRLASAELYKKNVAFLGAWAVFGYELKRKCFFKNQIVPLGRMLQV